MAEYTYEDIIMDPEDPRLEGAIGKECFFADYPMKLLENARSNSSVVRWYRLKSISKDEKYPFADHDGHTWILIIIKKEEEPEYVPFEDGDEFLECYLSKANNPPKHKLESVGGIWLKGFDTDVYFMVTELWDDGVVINDSKMRTTEIDEDEYLTVHGVTKWKELLEDYTFLDGSPCGKEVEE